MLNLDRLNSDELASAREAADCLIGLRRYLEPVLYAKLETFRADLDAQAEDRTTIDLDSRRAAGPKAS